MRTGSHPEGGTPSGLSSRAVYEEMGNLALSCSLLALFAVSSSASSNADSSSDDESETETNVAFDGVWRASPD